MKVGQLRLDRMSAREAAEFATLVEALDRLAVRQHVFVSDAGIARRLQACPYVVVEPAVTSPVMANCLMPDIDVAHAHDEKGGQAALLMTLTRSIPYVFTARRRALLRRRSLHASMQKRAASLLSARDLRADTLIEIYERVLAERSEFPEDADCGQ